MKPTTAPDQKHPDKSWHALGEGDALAALTSNADAGLTRDEASRRLARVGPNALPEPESRSLLSVFLGQFKSPLIYLLLAAAGVALAMGHVNDAVVIFIVVLLNSFVGALQEGRAERSLAALRKLATTRARIVRDGQEVVVDAREIVPGDILLLEAGDAVPADARLLQEVVLQVAEASLTGESVPVSKHLAAVPVDTLLADRRNMVYAGTYVTAGRARALVVATGLATELGRIATLASKAEESSTPLELRIATFGRYIMVAAGVLFVAVISIGMLRGVSFGDIVMVAISQVVGMIPEGLPVAMTIALAVGVQRMARRRAVVRRLAAVETLGSTTVICSDKTGTLTRNEMTVTTIHLAGGRVFSVTGAGYAPEGDFLENGKQVDPTQAGPLRELLEAIVLCNDAQLHGPEASEPRWKPIGDPTEVALLTLAVKGGLAPALLKDQRPRRAEIPFDSAAKMMATQHGRGAGARVVIKGAPEEVLALCRAGRQGDAAEAPLGEEELASLRGATDAMAAQALRVLAVAVVDGGELSGSTGFESLRGKATLLGFVGQIDPPRHEVAGAVRQCLEAGIRPVMVTGDHKVTGQAIARTLGIARDGDLAIDGRELEQLSDAALAERIEGISVFARVHPAQKLRIVDAYQRRGDVVAMTGDGVNDAPALVKANVGVAMGLTGTEVAKEASKIVIMDDNFATIVAAVEEGRVVYRNIKKVMLYLFSTSMAEVLVLLTALILGYRPPLAAVQILWINLVTEGTVTVNLVMEPPEGDEMQRKPIAANEPLLTRSILGRMLFMTPSIAISTLGWFIYRTWTGLPFAQVQTETFTVLAVCQWFNVLSCRSERHSAFDLRLFKNRWLIGGLVLGNLLQLAVVFLPPLNKVFHTVPIPLSDMFAIGVVASLVFWVEELRKAIVRWRAPRIASGQRP
ncbi:MAG: HAD-IC family P-type ATPase [Archangium sp.]|nr:HAD-IC family P-type ATPase [Archangium sp.]